ncbi:hypothetical protein MNBD_GAMMA22-2608 [hydrothermal vent metagenome]|uniref:Uncharacterized protein n=1 Tax=hydrothermal vent metagenome TaxID=652676 RepID=A0A3B0ZPD3_9ZZZZ
MDINLVNEIISCMPKERTIFRYFKDRYAFMLLERFIGEGESVATIKRSSFSGLLNKPDVKLAIANAGKGILTSTILNSVWPEDTHHFILTLGSWGSNSRRWDQTSRRGYNLVLQLNFSNEHDEQYKRMAKPKFESILNFIGHPILELEERDYFRETLAWSRIDLDFDKNEVLIEEIQCDWLRRAKNLLRNARFYRERNINMSNRWGFTGSLDNIIKYCEEVLLPYNKIWSEAMLAATIEFIDKELGIKNIYYHSDSTGYKVKKIKYDKPPRSLYSKLPSKFCFSKTNNAPDFLLQDKNFKQIYKKVDNPEWYRMAI